MPVYATGDKEPQNRLVLILRRLWAFLSRRG